MTGLDVKQFHHYIVTAALQAAGLYSEDAARLVTATALAESGLRWVDQVTKGVERPGPAYGLFQMEALTYHDHWDRFLIYKPDLSARIERMMIPGLKGLDQLHGNHYFAAVMCRVHYLRKPEPLPSGGDLRAMGAYWKKYYNTAAGKGTVDGFAAKAAAVMGV